MAGVRALRPCLDCGRPTASSRCPACHNRRFPSQWTPPPGWQQTRARVFARLGRRCLVPTADGSPCGAPAASVDHIVPRSQGGTEALANLRPACKSCNSRRSAYEHLNPHRKPPS